MGPISGIKAIQKYVKVGHTIPRLASVGPNELVDQLFDAHYLLVKIVIAEI